MTADEGASRRAETGDGSDVFGPIDAGALRVIRDLFAKLEPAVESASLDDPVNPRTLSVELADGVGDASASRLDVRWSLSGNYAFHYTDDENRNFRFDRHPKPDAPDRHFHPPPDAPDRPAEPSCTSVFDVGLVTRAVHQRWRVAYEEGTFDAINDAENPP